MRTSTECRSRADECRRLAKLAARPEDWGHFLEMAETWELLAKERKADEQVDEQVADEEIVDELAAILALADGIANSRNLGQQ